MAKRLDLVLVAAAAGALALVGVVGLPRRNSTQPDERTVRWSGTLQVDPRTPFVDASTLRLTTELDPRRPPTSYVDRRVGVDAWGGFEVELPAGRYSASLPTARGEIELGSVVANGVTKTANLTLPCSVLIVNVETREEDEGLAARVGDRLELRCGVAPPRRPDLRRVRTRNVFLALPLGAYEVCVDPSVRIVGAEHTGFVVRIDRRSGLREVTIGVAAAPAPERR